MQTRGARIGLRGGPRDRDDLDSVDDLVLDHLVQNAVRLQPGKQGHDGYFDVKCFDAQANACAQYLKAGREVAIDGRLLFDEFQTQNGSYASRIYIVAERVEFLATRKPTNGQASDEASLDKPAETGAAREAHQAA
jgi:single-strand DNA-binding protein